MSGAVIFSRAMIFLIFTEGEEALKPFPDIPISKGV